MSTNRSFWRLCSAVMLAFALIAAACGGDSDDGDGGDGATTVAEGGGSDTTGNGDGGDGEGSMGDPVVGGSLRVLLEAESDTWSIPGANCAVSCITVMRSVADPLTIVDSNGEVQPFLLESYEANADFTEHTLTMREGVTFHNGSPADGAAVQRNLQEMAAGLLQGQVFLDLLKDAEGAVAENAIELVDEMTVVVRFDVPFATFGNNLAERTGWLFAPEFWDSESQATDLAIATGPFEMTAWGQGGGPTIVEKNENYWRTDAAGNALPYLDEIQFDPTPDVNLRRDTMSQGTADVNMDSFGINKEFWQTEWDGQLAAVTDDREVGYLMFNNSAPPFDDPQFRKAITHCTDRDRVNELRSPGTKRADGPFAEGSLGYLEDPGFPQFDLEEANRILDEIGRPDVVTYGTTNVQENLTTAELYRDMWSENCGLNVEIDQFDQSELINRAIGGAFEVFLWRNHGQGHPGLEYIWWHSRHAEGLALNFGRIVDADLDALMQESWTTTDPAELDRIAQDINRLFAEQVYNMWGNETEWNIPYQNDVHGVGLVDIPGGGTAQDVVAGRIWLSQAYKDA